MFFRLLAPREAQEGGLRRKSHPAVNAFSFNLPDHIFDKFLPLCITKIASIQMWRLAEFPFAGGALFRQEEYIGLHLLTRWIKLPDCEILTATFYLLATFK